MEPQNLISVLRRMALLSAFCLMLEIVRIVSSFDISYIFLPWNLVLAWIPVALAIPVSRSQRPEKLLILLCLWAAFFPNAPYIITDFLHFKQRSNVPLWYDAILIYSFAFTGFLLGIISALLVYRKLIKILPGFVARSFIAIVLLLSGYGIYVGRYLRYNSWSLFLHPIEIAVETSQRIIHPTGYPRTYYITIITGTLLCLVFFIFEALVYKKEEIAQ